MWLTSKETKAVLKLSDCELMHCREAGKLTYQKRGNAFYYQLPEGQSLLAHPLGKQLLCWHHKRHQLVIDNSPIEPDSIAALEALVERILIPLSRVFSTPIITYGFTSFELKKHIQKHSSEGTAPKLDQHSSYETNSKGNRICSRGGAACDLIIETVSSAEITRYIVANLDFDRIYFYGSERPLHVSVHCEEPSQHLQIMANSANGRRHPLKRAFGQNAIDLAETL